MPASRCGSCNKALKSMRATCHRDKEQADYRELRKSQRPERKQRWRGCWSYPKLPHATLGVPLRLPRRALACARKHWRAARPVLLS
jgi:hypothetical protein